MAKIDDVFTSLEAGINNPSTSLYRVLVEDKYMETVKVRRRDASLTHHPLWCLSIGETGAQPAMFYGHNPTQCIKAALGWKGLPTKTRKGPKQKAA